jgi:hypothetical protein
VCGERDRPALRSAWPRVREHARTAAPFTGATARRDVRTSDNNIVVKRVVAYIRGELERRTLARTRGPGAEVFEKPSGVRPYSARARLDTLSHAGVPGGAARAARAKAARRYAQVTTGTRQRRASRIRSLDRPTGDAWRLARSVRLLYTNVYRHATRRVCAWLAALFRRPSARASVSRLSRLSFR